jgi:outer membrane lipopolysaccharide assembly protein LptE/RlpB
VVHKELEIQTQLAIFQFHQLAEDQVVLKVLFQLVHHHLVIKLDIQVDRAEVLPQEILKLEEEAETLEVIVHQRETVADKIIHYNPVEAEVEELHKVALLALL